MVVSTGIWPSTSLRILPLYLFTIDVGLCAVFPALTADPAQPTDVAVSTECQGCSVPSASATLPANADLQDIGISSRPKENTIETRRKRNTVQFQHYNSYSNGFEILPIPHTRPYFDNYDEQNVKESDSYLPDSSSYSQMSFKHERYDNSPTFGNENTEDSSREINISPRNVFNPNLDLSKGLNLLMDHLAKSGSQDHVVSTAIAGASVSSSNEGTSSHVIGSAANGGYFAARAKGSDYQGRSIHSQIHGTSEKVGGEAQAYSQDQRGNVLLQVDHSEQGLSVGESSSTGREASVNAMVDRHTKYLNQEGDSTGLYEDIYKTKIPGHTFAEARSKLNPLEHISKENDQSNYKELDINSHDLPNNGHETMQNQENFRNDYNVFKNNENIISNNNYVGHKIDDGGLHVPIEDGNIFAINTDNNINWSEDTHKSTIKDISDIYYDDLNQENDYDYSNKNGIIYGENLPLTHSNEVANSNINLFEESNLQNPNLDKNINARTNENELTTQKYNIEKNDSTKSATNAILNTEIDLSNVLYPESGYFEFTEDDFKRYTNKIPNTFEDFEDYSLFKNSDQHLSKDSERNINTLGANEYIRQNYGEFKDGFSMNHFPSLDRIEENLNKFDLNSTYKTLQNLYTTMNPNYVQENDLTKFMNKMSKSFENNEGNSIISNPDPLSKSSPANVDTSVGINEHSINKSVEYRSEQNINYIPTFDDIEKTVKNIDLNPTYDKAVQNTHTTKKPNFVQAHDDLTQKNNDHSLLVKSDQFFSKSSAPNINTHDLNDHQSKKHRGNEDLRKLYNSLFSNSDEKYLNQFDLKAKHDKIEQNTMHTTNNPPALDPYLPMFIPNTENKNPITDNFYSNTISTNEKYNNLKLNSKQPFLESRYDQNNQRTTNFRDATLLNPKIDFSRTLFNWNRNDDIFPPHGSLFNPGERIPGIPGYVVPNGFRGKILYSDILPSSRISKKAFHGPGTQSYAYSNGLTIPNYHIPSSNLQWSYTNRNSASYNNPFINLN